jgi:hypothetical protein
MEKPAMSVSPRTRALAALAALLAACQASSEPTPGAAGESSLFEPRPGDWRPLSTNLITFYHVAESARRGESLKTYVETVDGEVFQRLYGNLVLSHMDYRTSAVTGDANAFGPMVVSSKLIRVDTTEAFRKFLAETGAWLSRPQPYSIGHAEIFLFPDRRTFDRFARFVDSGGVAGLKPLRRLSEGCLSSRLVDPGTKNEAAILLAHVPDGEMSLGDPADRACLHAFLLENMGVRPDQGHLVLPGLPGSEYGDCSIARILPVTGETPKRTRLACPDALNRRAVMLLHYLGRRGAAGDEEAAALAGSVRKNCAELLRRGNRQDLSCGEIVEGGR